MKPESVYRALSSGPMRQQAAALSEPARRSIAEYVTGHAMSLARLADADAMPNHCKSNPRFDPTQGPSWNGWGVNSANTRFQTEAQAALRAADVPHLALKWAFGFPGASAVWGQPAVAGGRVFLGVDSGYVYALNAESGCVYWSFEADAGVHTAITLGRIANASNKRPARTVAWFADMKANAYAVDAQTGELLWKVPVDDHPTARAVGAPKMFDRHLYVTIASGEENAGGNANYPCCTFRGSISSLDAATGRRIWKTYSIADAPRRTGTSENGVQRWGPAGAGLWSTPTIDPKRGVLYVGTGDGYTEPAAATTDSILAVDLATGKIRWSAQGTKNDVWLVGCAGKKPSAGNCPATLGPDHDFASPPILENLRGGRQLLVAGQKSGNVWAFDPDRRGATVWKTALTEDTTRFGGKIIWGGASDGATAYFGLGTGGVAAVNLIDGRRKWFTPMAPTATVAQHVGQDGPLTAIPGIVFSGGWDGVLRALSADDGRILWSYDSIHEYQTVNGLNAKGGSMGAAGPVIAGGTLFAGSGYIGVKGGVPGNVLLAFSVPAK